jgi:glycerol-1-phosphate dehydrogenase [NAD(P)+]
MIAETIAAALRQASDTREVPIGEGVLSECAHVFRRNFGEAAVALSADENGYRAAGLAAREELLQAGLHIEAQHIFPGAPRLHPEIERVEEVRRLLSGSQAVAFVVGSGTLNDIVKLASAQGQRPYMVVATAASMDGYTSFAAAITHAGVKRVDPCPAPRALVADVRVLAAAPAELTSSGYGDLASGLVMAGLAMQAARSSWPASGCEHFFSHLWEMEGLPNAGREVSHGFKVGLGAVAAAAFYESLLQQDLAAMDVPTLVRARPSAQDMESEVRAAFSLAPMAKSAAEETLAKYGDAHRMEQRLHAVKSRWAEMRETPRAQLMPAAHLANLLAQAGCPTTPEALGLKRTNLRRGYNRARMLRTRYTALDLAFESGTFNSVADALFARGGYWAKPLTEGIPPAACLLNNKPQLWSH